MATQGGYEKLSGRQIVRLAASIPADDLAAITKDYMNISYVTIQSVQRHNPLVFNIQLIRHWIMRNPDNQVNVSNCKFNMFAVFLYSRYALIKTMTSFQILEFILIECFFIFFFTVEAGCSSSPSCC